MDVNYNIRINKQLRDNFKVVAQQNAHNPSALVRKFMEDYIYQNKGEILMDKGFGIVEVEGKEYALNQDAYLAGTHEEPHYEAHAEDAKGNEFMVYWNITHPDFKNLEDESEACDWENPREVESI